MHDPFLLTIIFIFAICIGSFLNVIIYRLPLGKSIIKPESRCPQCHNSIRAYDNVPIISFIILGGKCRDCGTRISIRYPGVEALTGLLAVWAFYSFGFSARGFETALLSLLFIPIFFIDLEHRIIPDPLDWPWIAVGLAFSFIPGALVGWKGSISGIIVGGGLFFLVLWLGEMIFKKEAMGFGDVKFAAMLGAFLGWENILLILVLASFFGSVVGIALIVFSRRQGNSTIVPFGPFLVAAAIIAIYYGDRIIETYKVFVGWGKA